MALNHSNHKHGEGRECVITRRACFSSSHRYWLPEKSPEENFALFGKCSFSPGHGHNYELVVSMGGELDPYGMVLNLSDVKHSIKNKVTGPLDFRFLNEVWPEWPGLRFRQRIIENSPHVIDSNNFQPTSKNGSSHE